jgi:hypothetical protein
MKMRSTKSGLFVALAISCFTTSAFAEVCSVTHESFMSKIAHLIGLHKTKTTEAVKAKPKTIKEIVDEKNATRKEVEGWIDETN